MKITWEVEDGYIGKSRPQTTVIPDDELCGLSEEEREDFIDEWIEEEFQQKISWSIISRE